MSSEFYTGLGYITRQLFAGKAPATWRVFAVPNHKTDALELGYPPAERYDPPRPAGETRPPEATDHFAGDAAAVLDWMRAQNLHAASTVYLHLPFYVVVWDEATTDESTLAEHPPHVGLLYYGKVFGVWRIAPRLERPENSRASVRDYIPLIGGKFAGGGLVSEAYMEKLGRYDPTKYGEVYA